ncbi:MAG: AAA domain-containing protein, partial [Clostridia bacterium]
RSTALLARWLEERRSEAETLFGSIPRPTGDDPAPSPRVTANDAVRQAFHDALMAAVPENEEVWTAEQRARAVLARLQFFYRREERPMWWRYFETLRYGPEELLEDSETIGGLELEGEDADHWYFRFDPEQEYKRRVGDHVADSRTGKGVGNLTTLDPGEARLSIKRQHHAVPPSIGLMQVPMANSGVLESALQHVASVVAGREQVIGDGHFAAVRHLLSRAAAWDADEHTEVSDSSMLARTRALRLHGQYLAVQGPPGTGKTSTGVRMVADLIAQGRVVGITALSHAVIRHLLEAAVAECRRRSIPCAAVQKVSSDGQGTTMTGVLVTDNNAKIEEGLEDGRFNLVAATAYLFARPALEEGVDVLIVDEAGQMTLANTVAAATAARSLVLLGDPQQLAQPVQGTHPPGAAVSALEHVLQGRP